MLVKFNEQQGGQYAWGSVNKGQKGRCSQMVNDRRSVYGIEIMYVNIIDHTVTFTPCKMRNQ